jgi:hypothetical protein
VPTFRGNRGNLLQHWVLVELLEDLRERQPGTLCFVDAHAMSPIATRSPKAATDQTAAEFDRVRAHLAEGLSPYELTWLSLSQSLGSEYPSSAAFVRHRWKGPLHLMLCEADIETAEEIANWLSDLDPSTVSYELHRGDWRQRFLQDIPSTYNAYYFSFDPNMYDRHDVRPPKVENMYPSDIDIACAPMASLRSIPIIVQLSTYSANGGNSQEDVLDNVVPLFEAHGFATAGCVCADCAMMSMIFTRDTLVAADLAQRFHLWRTGHVA